MRILLAFAILSGAAFGQGQNTTLMLAIRPQCGIVESSYTHVPETAETLLRFRYVARTGTQGGQFHLIMGLEASGVQITANIDGPVKILDGLTGNPNTNMLLAEINPNGRTQKSGHAGEIRLVWPNPGSAVIRPRLSLTCD
ncbi:MAG: hypothetical protein IH602_03830 [Bryobacteraceae bacterium]|nr:hypothetical protein [Bryobacteraceae bacterium]